VFDDDTWEQGDYRLQGGSPCLDAGSEADAPIEDIEGNARPCAAGFDLGAYERGGCAALEAFVRGDTNADGQVDIGDAIFALSYLFGGNAHLVCADAADANDDGALDLADVLRLLEYVFVEGRGLPRPAETCGTDVTVDALPCTEYAPCRQEEVNP
jgi:hypothetical protein